MSPNVSNPVLQTLLGWLSQADGDLALTDFAEQPVATHDGVPFTEGEIGAAAENLAERGYVYGVGDEDEPLQRVGITDAGREALEIGEPLFE